MHVQDPRQVQGQDAGLEDSIEVEERRASNSDATSSQSDGLAPEAEEGLRRIDALVDAWLVRHAHAAL